MIVNVSNLWYNIHMENIYTHTKTTVSMINYHFVFCPRYRRKIFLIDGVEARLKETVFKICSKNNIEVLAIECDVDHCHLFVSSKPTLSPADIMRLIKTNTSRVLRAEFLKLAKMPNLWTRSYFVSTAGNVSSETIKHYVETQKSR